MCKLPLQNQTLFWSHCSLIHQRINSVSLQLTYSTTSFCIRNVHLSAVISFFIFIKLFIHINYVSAKSTWLYGKSYLRPWVESLKLNFPNYNNFSLEMSLIDWCGKFCLGSDAGLWCSPKCNELSVEPFLRKSWVRYKKCINVPSFVRVSLEVFARPARSSKNKNNKTWRRICRSIKCYYSFTNINDRRNISQFVCILPENPKGEYKNRWINVFLWELLNFNEPTKKKSWYRWKSHSLWIYLCPIY